MFGWFRQKPKLSDGKNQLKKTRLAANESPAWDAGKNAAIMQAPLDRDLYRQALKAKGYISLKAVHERLVWQRLRLDDLHHDENEGSIIGGNAQRQNEAKVSVNFSPWNIVRGELIRVYAFKNLSGPGTETKIELRCRLFVEENKVIPFIHLLVKPRFSEQSKSVASVFAPSDAQADYKVLIARVEADIGVNFVAFDMADGEHLVNVLKLGREVTIEVAEFESDQPKYVILHLAYPEWCKR